MCSLVGIDSCGARARPFVSDSSVRQSFLIFPRHHRIDFPELGIAFLLLNDTFRVGSTIGIFSLILIHTYFRSYGLLVT